MQLRQIVTVNPSPGHRGSSIRASSGTMLRVLGAAQKREVKATQNLSFIVLFFMICWVPLYTINCVQAFCPQCTVSDVFLNSCIILSHMNSAGNPLLYAYHLRDFRAALKHFLYQIFRIKETPTINLYEPHFGRASVSSCYQRTQQGGTWRHQSLQQNNYHQVRGRAPLNRSCTIQNILPPMTTIQNILPAIEPKREMWNIKEMSEHSDDVRKSGQFNIAYIDDPGLLEGDDDVFETPVRFSNSSPQLSKTLFLVDHPTMSASTNFIEFRPTMPNESSSGSSENLAKVSCTNNISVINRKVSDFMRRHSTNKMSGGSNSSTGGRTANQRHHMLRKMSADWVYSNACDRN